MMHTEEFIKENILNRFPLKVISKLRQLNRDIPLNLLKCMIKRAYRVNANLPRKINITREFLKEVR